MACTSPVPRAPISRLPVHPAAHSSAVRRTFRATTSVLVLLMGWLLQGRAVALSDRTYPDLTSAALECGDRVFDHLLSHPLEGVSGWVQVVPSRSGALLDPLRSASAAMLLEDRLRDRGVRLIEPEGGGSPLVLRVGVHGMPEGFRMIVDRDGSESARTLLVETRFVEKPWVQGVLEPSARYPLLFRVSTATTDLERDGGEALWSQVARRVEAFCQLSRELPRAFVAERARHWELDRYLSVEDDELVGPVRHVTALYGLTPRHLEEVRVEVRRIEREHLSRWTFRLAWILGSLALATLSYLHCDWKTRGYLSRPLKVAFFLLFVLVVSAGFGLS